jgi:hypothetical protein
MRGMQITGRGGAAVGSGGEGGVKAEAGDRVRAAEGFGRTGERAPDAQRSEVVEQRKGAPPPPLQRRARTLPSIADLPTLASRQEG